MNFYLCCVHIKQDELNLLSHVNYSHVQFWKSQIYHYSMSYISECRYVLVQPYLVVIGGGGEENSTQDQDYDLKHFFPTVDH